MRLLSLIKSWFAPFPKVRSLDGLHGLDKADVLFHNLVAERKVPGLAVSVFDKREVHLQKGYGFANLESREKIDPKSTVFRIASISKCITGLAFGKMVEEGILGWDDSLYDYEPYFPKKGFDITLRQLASHTAGIRAYKGKEFAMDRDFSIKDSIQVFKNDPLIFQPGHGYLYNSFDFVLLSLAMQEASGIPFPQYVKEKVLMPLGLDSTNTTEDQQQNAANFYTKRSHCFKPAMPVNNTYKLAGGGFLSTSVDIAKLGQAVLEGKLLKKETYDQLLTSQTVNGKPTYYGLGFQVSQDAAGRSFVGHVGNSVGAYTNLFIYPKEEKVVSILINCTDPKVQKELDEAISCLFEQLV
jgi:CubicO group peptidase (beta-lactamase class C family)